LNPKQRENLAKYCYDISKVIVAILVIGPITRPEQVTAFSFILAAAGSVAFVVLGLLLDKEKKS